MFSKKYAGWLRLGIAISILWLVCIAGLVAYEWMNVTSSGHFVEVVAQTTGEPVSTLEGNIFSDLVPKSPAVKWKLVMSWVLVPLLALWLLGSLISWVILGFVHART